jgi:hypothetical protein
MAVEAALPLDVRKASGLPLGATFLWATPEVGAAHQSNQSEIRKVKDLPYIRWHSHHRNRTWLGHHCREAFKRHIATSKDAYDSLTFQLLTQLDRGSE